MKGRSNGSEHPVTTVVPRYGPNTNFLVRRFCPQLDLISYNSSDRFKEGEDPGEIKGPFIVAELGPEGYWSTQCTDWYSQIEPGSAEKIAFLNNNLRPF